MITIASHIWEAVKKAKKMNASCKLKNIMNQYHEIPKTGGICTHNQDNFKRRYVFDSHCNDMAIFVSMGKAGWAQALLQTKILVTGSRERLRVRLRLLQTVSARSRLGQMSPQGKVAPNYQQLRSMKLVFYREKAATLQKLWEQKLEN